jgi:hypothetical protein
LQGNVKLHPLSWSLRFFFTLGLFLFVHVLWLVSSRRTVGVLNVGEDLFTNILRQLLPLSSSTAMPQYFAPKDILLLTDAYCASTCTIFAEELKTQAGVKSVVIGGRPEYGSM